MKKTILSTYVLFLFFTFTTTYLSAQDYQLTDSLKQNLEKAKTDEEKVRWLGELATFYVALNRDLSDEYGKQQIQIAELNRDRRLMVKALLSNANRLLNMGVVQDNLNKACEYSQQALNISKTSYLDDYTAWSYLYLARVARNDGEMDKALNFNNLALSLASSVADDSLKVSCLNSIGGTYLVKNEKLLAFRHYLQALNIAAPTKRYTLLRNCYYNMSNFYMGLEEFEKSKDYLFKVLHLTYQYHQPFDRLDVYSSIGKVYTANKQYELATTFYEKSMMLADTLKNDIFKLNSYGNIIDQYFVSNQAEKALAYFNSKKELRDFMLKAGFHHFINQAYGIAYMETGKLDSAGFYLAKAEPQFEARATKMNKYYFYNNYAKYYNKKKDYKKSIEYNLKAKKISEEMGNIKMLQDVSKNLDSLYQKLGDYHNAYLYNFKFHQYKDSLQTLSTEKDLLLLEVDNENKRKELEAIQLEEAKRTRHNIQYMGITAAIAGVFIVLVMLGAFSVSHATIKILGFFAFIFLFEFIILLADNQIHHWTHGEPWKILAIKIGLISILLPLHHFLEEKVIHYLISRKLLEVNPRGIITKLYGKRETADTTGS
ncbi:MAG: tetratricopeptide repeat protein [Bacteroidota bacterium]